MGSAETRGKPKPTDSQPSHGYETPAGASSTDRQQHITHTVETCQLLASHIVPTLESFGSLITLCDVSWLLFGASVKQARLVFSTNPPVTYIHNYASECTDHWENLRRAILCPSTLEPYLLVNAVMGNRIQAARLFSRKFRIKLCDCIEPLVECENIYDRKKPDGGAVLMKAFKHCQDKESLEWVLDESQAKGNKRLILYSLAGACSAGSLENVEWMVRKFSLRREDLMDWFHVVFKKACSSGRLSVAQWIAKHFNYGRDEVEYFRNEPFWSACTNGHLEVVKWLSESFSVWESSPDLLQAVCRTENRDLIFWFGSKPFNTCTGYKSRLLETLGKVGDRELISWFSKKIALENDILKDYLRGSLIKGAISGGHLKLVEETIPLLKASYLTPVLFTEWFEIACTQPNPDIMTLFDTYIPGNYIINSGVSRATLGGLTHVVQWWLVNSMKDSMPERTVISILNAACAGGHLDIVKLIISQRGLTKTDVLSNAAFHYAIGNGHLPVIKWLVVSMGITKEDIPDLALTVRKLVTRNHIATALWLNSYFSLGMCHLWG